MKKLILTILLTITSTSALAEWTYLTSSKDADYYVDKTDIRKKGNTVKMWAILNYNSPHELGSRTYLSMKSLKEFDCVEVTVAIISSVYFFSGSMSSGEMIFQHKTDPKPEDIAPDTSMKVLWETACNK